MENNANAGGSLHDCQHHALIDTVLSIPQADRLHYRSMKQFLYIVNAVMPDDATRQRYIDWLANGHVQQVIAGGALWGEIIDLSESGRSPGSVAAGEGEVGVVQTRYGFASREAYDRYVEQSASRLRAEGLALFGPDSGVRFFRQLGELRGRFGTMERL